MPCPVLTNSHRRRSSVTDLTYAHHAAQARLLAKRLGPLADGFPRSIKEAVRMHRVPAELEPDLMCAPASGPLFSSLSLRIPARSSS